MIDEKFKYGLKQYFRPTPTKVKEWLLYMKAILSIPIVATMAEEKLVWSVALLLAGFAFEEAGKFVGQNPELFALEEAKDQAKELVNTVVEEIKTRDDEQIIIEG